MKQYEKQHGTALRAVEFTLLPNKDKNNIEIAWQLGEQ